MICHGRGLRGTVLHWRMVDLMIPALSVPVPGLLIGLVGLWWLARTLRRARQESAALLDGTRLGETGGPSPAAR